MFRIDVTRYPAALQQLAVPPTKPRDTLGDIHESSIPQGLQDRWAGPYLEVGTITDTTDVLTTAAGAAILPLFETTTLNSTDFWTIRVANIDTPSIERINVEIDGAVDVAAGRIQATERNDSVFMLYLAAPIN